SSSRRRAGMSAGISGSPSFGRHPTEASRSVPVRWRPQRLIALRKARDDSGDVDMVAVYRQSAEDVVATLGTDVRRGLTEAEALARLERLGANRLAHEPPVPSWRKFLAQFQDALVVLLLVATAISAVLWMYERDTALPYEALAIVLVVLLNAVMGYVQETRAESA